jgi:translation initiation factor 4G
MNIYFKRINDLSNHPKLSSRIRFMLQDLIEMRQNGWKARQQQVGPVTIAEIHAMEEKKQRQKEEEEARARAASGRGGRGGGYGSHPSGYKQGGGYKQGPPGGYGSSRGSGPQDARANTENGGWSTVDSRTTKSSRNQSEADTLQNFGKMDIKKPLHLGPQGPSRSNSLAAAASLSKDEKGGSTSPSTAGNMFR